MRVLCFGDSNTYGYDPRSYFGDRYPAEERWGDILAAETGGDVLAQGENGREIPRHPWELSRVRELLEESRPEVFVVMLGTNDLLQGASAIETGRRMKAFLKEIQPMCGKILLIAPPPMKLGAWVWEAELVKASVQMAEEYQNLARGIGTAFADAGLWEIGLAYDGVHFSEAGHRRFAREIRKYLEEIAESFCK